MTEQQFEENRIQDRNISAQQKVDEIAAALSNVFQKSASLETAIEVIKAGVADPESFRHEVVQKCIDLESSINTSYRQAQLADKSLKRSAERLKRHYDTHRESTRHMDMINTEIQDIQDYMEQIDDEMETIEIEGTEESSEIDDGSPLNLPEIDIDTLIRMRAKSRYKPSAEDEEDHTVDAIEHSKRRI